MIDSLVVKHKTQDTIVALSTVPGQSAIAVIRLSGPQAIAITDNIFKGAVLSQVDSHTVHYGKLFKDNVLLDEVVVAVFKNPHSYTGEDVIEISAHGSPYIVQTILRVLQEEGARMARPGEFTQRAFFYGKLDLSQAEAVADIIASENASQHRIAFQQMRGGYSERIKTLRQELIDFAALLELELDFSEEDVEFANREKLVALVHQAQQEISRLIQSFKLGNVIKKGIPVAIVGKPNAGKSTLLNVLLQDEKAIVSDIPGTTRDFIEDTLQINGITYRFIDTAGLRETSDALENLGIERSYEKMKQAGLVLVVLDIRESLDALCAQVKALSFEPDQKAILVLNKSDAMDNLCNAYDVEEAMATLTRLPVQEVSAKQHRNIDKLIEKIEQAVQLDKLSTNDVVVSNSRHWEALQEAHTHLVRVLEGLEQKISGEFISLDMRAALQALGRITGQVSNEDILSSVFTRFCIGK